MAIERIKQWWSTWWDGETIMEPVFGPVRQPLHWTSRLTHWCWDLWCEKWDRLLPIGISILSLALSGLALFVAARVAKII